MSVVTNADVETVLGRTMTAAEAVRSTRLIQFAEARFEATFPGFSIATGTETVEVAAPRDGELWTPKYPVTAVSAVTADDVAVSLASFDIKGKLLVPGDTLDTTYTWQLNLPTWLGVTWEVTYAFGKSPLPLEIVEVIAGMVAGVIRRHATNPDNVQSEMLGAYQVSYGDYNVKAYDLGMSVSDDQRDALKRWLRTAMVSVRAR